MIKMRFDNYYSELERMKGLDDTRITEDYGITAKDIEVMKKNPEKYVFFCMYLISRPWYSDECDEVKVFANADALPALKVTEALDEIINDALELFEEEED